MLSCSKDFGMSIFEAVMLETTLCTMSIPLWPWFSIDFG